MAPLAVATPLRADLLITRKALSQSVVLSCPSETHRG